MSQDDMMENRIWSYVHGQMAASDRSEMERMIAADASLRAEVMKARSSDAYLRTLVPMMEQTDEALEDQVMQAWEADRVQAQQARATVERRVSRSDAWDRFKSWFTMPMPALRLALVAASCMLMMVGLHNYRSPDLRMMSPELMPVVSRSGDVMGLYAREDLQNFSMRLNRAIMARYDSLEPRSRRKSVFRRVHDWSLRCSLQELDEGMISAEVSAHGQPDQPPLNRWRKIFVSADAFSDGADAFGADIADQLVSMQSREP